MGHAIAQRAIEGGHDVVGFDFSEHACEAARQSGVDVVPSMEDVARATRCVWIMVPAGDPVDQVIATIIPRMKAGDIIIDGGNSKFTDSMRRAHELKKHSIAFLDCGTSGGLRGREVGFSLMIGGDQKTYETLIPVFTAIAAPQGFALVGPSGAGHYVKMVHNGIEYGLMQAYAEGFHLLKDGSFKESDLDLEKISNVWMHGSVIRSFLLELAHDIFEHDQQLSQISGIVEESGMGLWTVEDAQQHNVPVCVIKESLDIRARSRKMGGNYGTKVVALLRKAFGGHAIHKAKGNQ
jgi:6-phosphogluconate dehydrogenase